MGEATLHQFFKHATSGGMRNAFIVIPDFRAHIFGKLGKLAVRGELRPFFMVGQIVRDGREENIQYKDGAQRTGKLLPLVTHLNQVANQYGFDLCFYSIINEFLAGALRRYGFRPHGATDMDGRPSTVVFLREWAPENNWNPDVEEPGMMAPGA